MTAQSLADRLEHAIATASNDDYSKVGTRERERHVERIGVMQDCLASLRQSGEAIERAETVAVAIAAMGDAMDFVAHSNHPMNNKQALLIRRLSDSIKELEQIRALKLEPPR